MATKKSGEAFGISGFTLGIAGFTSLLFSPLLSILFCIIGVIFCGIQQKNKKTKLGKTGLIINVLGIVASIAYFIILIKYLMPLIQQQTGSFPVDLK